MNTHTHTQTRTHIHNASLAYAQAHAHSQGHSQTRTHCRRDIAAKYISHCRRKTNAWPHAGTAANTVDARLEIVLYAHGGPCTCESAEATGPGSSASNSLLTLERKSLPAIL